MFNKYWFLKINIISFIISMIDAWAWRGSPEGSFPIFAFIAIGISGIIGGIYLLTKIIKIIQNGKIGQGIIFLIILVNTWYLLGAIGAIAGLLCSGLLIFGI